MGTAPSVCQLCLLWAWTGALPVRIRPQRCQEAGRLHLSEWANEGGTRCGWAVGRAANPTSDPKMQGTEKSASSELGSQMWAEG